MSLGRPRAHQPVTGLARAVAPSAVILGAVILGAMILGVLSLAARPARADPGPAPRPGAIVRVPIDARAAYLIDPISESCLLLLDGTAAAQVSCRALARNHPPAARHIHWVTVRRRPTAAGPAPAAGDPAAQARQVDATHFTVPRAEFEAALQTPPAALRAVRLVPVRESGETLAGLRLAALRIGGPLHRLGLRNGDLLRAVNGEALTSASAAVAVYAALPGTRQLRLALTRDGHPLTLVWDIE